MNGTPRKRPPIDKDTVKYIGETLRKYREQLGWDRQRLEDATGYSRTFIANTEAGNGIGYPSRLSMRFMLDVMGADLNQPEIVNVLSVCADRGQRSPAVAAKMEAFYGRRPGQRPAELNRVLPPVDTGSWSPGFGLPVRTEQMDKLTADLMALAVERLDTPDVAKWIATNRDALTDRERLDLIEALVCRS
jgi:transcriptional regulator with XRE-family HTH domain